MTKRVYAPIGGHQTQINGITYQVAEGASIDVPDDIANILVANGYTQAAGSVSTTIARPAKPTKGATLHDTTLGINILFDGKNWRNPATGAIV